MRFDVISDIQGDLTDLDAALRALAELGPADALLVAGDLTEHGRADEYAQLMPHLHAAARPQQLYSIGNHDFYNGESSAVSIARFVEFTGMPGIYSAHRVGEVSVLRIGSTDGSESSGHCVVLGAAQLAWLAAELTTEPTIVLTHHAIPHTVSGTYDDPADQAPRLYQADYAEGARLTTLLAAHPNVVVLSGHTHWDLRRPDWIYRGRFTAINTGAIQRGFGPDGHGGEVPSDRPHNQGLRLELDGRRVRVQAFDFHAGEQLHEVEFELGRAT
ncbi:metallophosphoesterase family protein [Skermania piniformis]|uniref:Metallophosphoesterase n=1 Tax=Skermania pinensis TaxID=39122 RepID=A0ABX8S5V2_9ACTN|nr:metallophosphoesterase [Skermania piniformis]QXQ12836.1 metallophosphoesterase [Skermania piniformis]